jgi:methyl-accepting chemotaxis protein
LNVLDAGLRRIAAGDLGARCETPFADTFEGLRCDFNRALDALDESVSEITLSASALHGECAEARLRVMQERQTGAGELPQLSAAANGLKDIGDALKQHEAALAEIAIITSMVKQHHDDERNAAGTASHAAAALSDTSSAAAAAAAAMRDVAFRTNMLSVNINIAAAKSEPAQDMLRSFAMDLRSIAEDGATAARNISLLERDIAGSATAVRSSFDEIARKDKNIDASLAEAESKLSEIREATGTFSDLVTRTGTIIEGSAKTSGRRKDLDHVLDTILARMAQELALINRHCGRFIPVTLLRENAPPPESLQPRRRDHLRLIKS